MKKFVILGAVILLLVLSVGMTFADDPITGEFPQSCAVDVPPDYFGFGDTVYYAFYPTRGKLVAKCIVKFDNPPDKPVSYMWPGNEFCWDFPVGYMCTKGGVSTVYPDGQGRTIWRFTFP